MELFFSKKYDYYIILTLILISLLVSALNYYEVFIDKDAKGLYFNIPCFIKGQEGFIERASFHVIFYMGLSYLFGGYNLLVFLLEKGIESILIFGIYYFGKKVYLKYSKKFKTLFFILFFIYWLNIILALILSIVERCLLRIG